MNLNSFVKESFRLKIGSQFLNTPGNSQPYLHWHPHYEILIIKSGHYSITSNTTDYVSHKPTIVIHRPYCLHKLNADPDVPYARYIIHADKNILAQFPQSLLDMSDFADISMLRADPNPLELHELTGICEELLKCCFDLNPESDLVESALYTALLIHKAIGIYKSGRGEAYTTKYSYIQDVLQYITDNLSERLTVEELCKRFSVGSTKLLADFKSVTGSPYKKYLIDLRQNRARELLEAGESIINTSLECGYSSEAHFVKAFREYWGMTPGSFRQSDRG